MFRRNLALFAASLVALSTAAPMPPIGLFGSSGPSPADRRDYTKRRSCYMPHQGKRECARRVRQMAKREAKA